MSMVKKYSKGSKQKEIYEGILESQFNKHQDMSNDPYLKSLYPNAKKIEIYYHYIFDCDILVVDDKYECEYLEIFELIVYAYHTGTQYKDLYDLQNKYYTDLDNVNGIEGWYLP